MTTTHDTTTPHAAPPSPDGAPATATPAPAVRGQQSLSDFVLALERAGLLKRITEPTRVDQLAQVLQANPRQAVLVEQVVDCEFQFLANAYSNQDQYAWALGCTKAETGRRLSELARGRVKWEVVDTAPCKEVVLRGDDVDLARLPQFLYHERDGQAYTTDNFVVSKDPATGIYDWGIYRSMFRTRTEKNFDMTCTSHRQRLHGLAARANGRNLPAAVVIGVPLLDHLAGLQGVPDTTDDFEVLGSFYGQPAKMVKCETLDLVVPANAEIVLEGELVTSEGWVHDEGPFGEFTGMYGGGLKHNVRFVVHCMTYRKGGIYQYATVGGKHPGHTDNMIQLPMIEADLFRGLRDAGLDVVEVRADAAGLSNIAYAKIRPRGGGDAKQALAVMLTCSKQGLPKIAMVFDDDIDIWDDDEVKWAMAFRYMPDRDTLILPQQNTMSVDPKIPDVDHPFSASKIGWDCTKPLVGTWDPHNFDRCLEVDLGAPPATVEPMTEAELTADMEAFIKAAPRAWKDILERYLGQPYPAIYHAFGSLRHRLGRAGNAPWYGYTFSDRDFAFEPEPPPALANHDPRHAKP